MIAIVDYGMGNLGSIHNMLHRLGVESAITSDAAVIRRASRLILPGVGAFDTAMRTLDELGLVAVLRERVFEGGVPLLGVCLGMQLLSRRSDEGALPGLGWIEADTVRFVPEPNERLRLPHMGWNAVRPVRAHPLFAEAFDDSRFYFVHSYHVRCDHPEDVLATTPYAGTFHSAVGRGHVLGTQFHPEKSHKYGLRLLAAFTRL